MRYGKLLQGILAAGALFAGGCMHLKGVVLTEPGEKPHPTAVLSVGRPGGISVIESHPVNKKGEFDFQVFPTDESNIFLFDSANPSATARQLERFELGENMKLHLRPPAADPFSGLMSQ